MGVMVPTDKLLGVLDGSVSGTPNFGSPRNLTWSGASDPRYGNYPVFSRDSYISTASVWVPPNTATYEGWIRVDQLENRKGYFFLTDYGTQGIYPFLYVAGTDSPKAGCLCFNVTSYTDILFTDTPITVGQWHHFALTLTGSTATWFLDGIKQPTTATYNYAWANNYLANLGGKPNEQLYAFTGSLSYFRVSDEVKYTDDFIPEYNRNQNFREINFSFFSSEVASAQKGDYIWPSHELRPTLHNGNVLDATSGGTFVGGLLDVKGSVKIRKGDQLLPYKDAVVFLAEQTTGFYHRETFTDENAEFSLRSLTKNYKYSVIVRDLKSELYKVVMDVEAGQTLEVILESDDTTPQAPTHKVEGHVTDYQGQPISRKVCVHSRIDNRLMGSVFSRASDGFYSISFVGDEKVYVVCLPDNDEDVNAKIFDRVVPVKI